MFIIKCLIYLFAFLILMKQPQITFVEILKVSKNSPLIPQHYYKYNFLST